MKVLVKREKLQCYVLNIGIYISKHSTCILSIIARHQKEQPYAVWSQRAACQKAVGRSPESYPAFPADTRRIQPARSLPGMRTGRMSLSRKCVHYLMPIRLVLSLQCPQHLLWDVGTNTIRTFLQRTFWALCC